MRKTIKKEVSEPRKVDYAVVRDQLNAEMAKINKTSVSKGDSSPVIKLADAWNRQ